MTDRFIYEESHDPDRDETFYMATDPAVPDGPHGVGYGKKEAAEDLSQRLIIWAQREGS